MVVCGGRGGGNGFLLISPKMALSIGLTVLGMTLGYDLLLCLAPLKSEQLVIKDATLHRIARPMSSLKLTLQIHIYFLTLEEL